MSRSRSIWLALVFVLVLHPSTSLASQPLIHPLQHPEDSLRVRGIVEGFFNLAVGRAFPPDSIDGYAADAFVERLQKAGSELLWPASTGYRVERVVAVGEGDQAVMVTAVTTGDTLPMFGPLAVDWMFYMRRNDSGAWRISTMRRMSGTDVVVETLRFLDTSTVYPAVLKREIAHEQSAMLLSNAQLRQHLAVNRAGFGKLLAEFTQPDSLKILGRIDRRASQLNTHGIYWGIAGEDVPKEAIDEYMRTATKEEREEMRKRLRLAESMRRQGTDTLGRLAKKAGISMRRIDSTIALMKDLRVSFVNRMLPWRDAVQITLAGKYGDALGYIYSPHGELPIIDPDEYFYLEELGDGWWIFRST